MSSQHVPEESGQKDAETEKTSTLLRPPGMAPLDTSTGEKRNITREYIELQQEMWDKEDSDQRSRFLGLIRDIRAEAQNLRTSFLEIQKFQVESGGTWCSVETLAVHAQIYSYNRQQIDDRIREVRAVLKANPGIHSDAGDEVTFIENIWERVTRILPDIEKPDKEHFLAAIIRCIAYLGDVIYHCNIITIPPRLKEHLSTQRTGRSLNFYKTFQDEFCTEEEAKNILGFLSRHPAFIDGVIDANNGVIYYAKPEKYPFNTILILIAAAFFGGIVTVFGMGLVMGNMALTGPGIASCFSWQGPLLAIMIAGAVVHVVIGAVKQMRSSEENSFTALEDWMIWIQIKRVPILCSIALILLGFVMLTATVNPLDRITVFIAGYSIDSLGDVFLARFDTIITTRTDALKKTMAPA